MLINSFKILITIAFLFSFKSSFCQENKLDFSIVDSFLAGKSFQLICNCNNEKCYDSTNSVRNYSNLNYNKFEKLHIIQTEGFELLYDPTTGETYYVNVTCTPQILFRNQLSINSFEINYDPIFGREQLFLFKIFNGYFEIESLSNCNNYFYEKWVIKTKN